MCVQCVAKRSIIPAVLTVIEIFIEENSQTLLLPWILLQNSLKCDLSQFQFSLALVVCFGIAARKNYHPNLLRNTYN